MNITFRRRLFFLTISIGAITTFSMVSCNNLRGNTPEIPDTSGGWVKYEGNPVLGGEEIGTCFDVNVTREGSAHYNMYFSWRPKAAIAISQSEDGMTWSEPTIVLDRDTTSGWEDEVNRSYTLYWNGQFHMWYVGQARGYSKIGYAISDDGMTFHRVQKNPVMIPELNYEGYSVMNPYVMRDSVRGVFRMWYASGETYEPNVICYAESEDGIHWNKSPLNPIFIQGLSESWDCDRVGGCEVHLIDGQYVMFYIGYTNIDMAMIGMAVSPDGITQWKRVGNTPIIGPTEGSWDQSACYKPSVCADSIFGKWLLWYNGRNNKDEYVGLAIHEGLNLISISSVI